MLIAAILLASAAAGLRARHRLAERHTTQAAADSIRLLIAMLVTFSALVLGLLVSNAKQRFDGFDDDLSAFATDLIELDHRLRMYGADADAIRHDLRAYTAAAIASSWPDEAAPGGTYPRMGESRSMESIELGDMLTTIDAQIERLAPADPFRERVAERMRYRMSAIIEARWRLIFSARSTIAWPFLALLTAWLAIIFAIFGLTAPPTRLIFAVVSLSAVSIASPVYLIVEYSDTLTGLVKLPSATMREALAHMDRTDEVTPPAR